MRKVEIKWRDSRIYYQQFECTYDFDVCVIISIGYLVSENKKQVVISRDDMGEGDCRGIIAIPRENIISKKFI